MTTVVVYFLFREFMRPRTVRSVALYVEVPTSIADVMVEERLASVTRPQRNTRVRRRALDLSLGVQADDTVRVTVLETPQTLARLKELILAWRSEFSATDTSELIVRSSEAALTVRANDVDSQSHVALMIDNAFAPAVERRAATAN